LNNTIKSIPDSQRNFIFCNGKIWYTAEIIYPQARNVINYDSNSVILHNIPSYQLINNKIVKHTKTIPSFNMLESYANKLQNLVQENSWRLNGPKFISLKKLSNGKALQDSVDKIDSAMLEATVFDYHTVYDYLSNLLLKNEVRDFVLRDGSTRNEIVKKIIGVPGSLHLKKLKEQIATSQHYLIDSLLENRSKIISDYIFPIEQAIYEFSNEVLAGIQSSLISNSVLESERIKTELSEIATNIKTLKDSNQLDALDRFGRKIGSIADIQMSCEGIVFLYKGEIYKFNGKFAPINSLLVLYKYGRKGESILEDSN
jgi:hypothetical protein